MSFKKNFTEEDYALLKSIYDRAEQSKGMSTYMQKSMDLEREILEKNPKIKRLKEYLMNVETIEGEFMYEDRKDGRLITSYEKFEIKGIRYNSNRQRLELETNREMECYIYLQMERNRQADTQHTRGYFSVFNMEEDAVVARFRQLYKCDGEEYVGTYLCTLDFSCKYKDEKNAICMSERKSNICGYRNLCES